MRVEHVNIYKYDELSPEAQERARDWFRTSSAQDNYFAESIADDFKELAKACGFALGGRNGSDGIYWSGFGSQGDGASFTGSWAASHVNVTALLADRPATYKDETGKEQTSAYNVRLRAVLEGFATLATGEPTGSGTVTASSRRGHGMRCGYDCDMDEGSESYETFCDRRESLTERFAELSRDLADWFYRALKDEYDCQNSDEVVADNIIANEYEFTEDGGRA